MACPLTAFGDHTNERTLGSFLYSAGEIRRGTLVDEVIVRWNIFEGRRREERMLRVGSCRGRYTQKSHKGRIIDSFPVTESECGVAVNPLFTPLSVPGTFGGGGDEVDRIKGHDVRDRRPDSEGWMS